MFTERARHWTQSLILLMLGLYFLDNMLSGRIYFYINERFGWLSWVATAILLTLGVMGITDLIRSRGTQAHDDYDHHEHAGHTHDSAPSWRILSIVAVPLALGLLVPARPLGAAAVGSSGVSTSFASLQGVGNATQLSIAPTNRNVLDWIRAFNGAKGPNEFNGQAADVVGFVYRDIRFKDQPYFMVARFTISCCVADASAIGITVKWPDAAKLSQDGWIRVTGKFSAETFDGEKMPILVAEKVEPTAQPDHPYLYP
jgi:putative membrane protein